MLHLCPRARVVPLHSTSKFLVSLQPHRAVCQARRQVHLAASTRVMQGMYGPRAGDVGPSVTVNGDHAGEHAVNGHGDGLRSKTIGEWVDEYDKRTHSASHDFRSDTFTLPTGAMMASILSDADSLGDDVFGEDGPTNALERFIETLTGTQKAVFVLSGTMGNQLALRCLLQQPPYSVICDARSHIFAHEAGMASMFSGAQLHPLLPDPATAAYLTLEDIIPNVVPDDGNAHCAPTRIIALECTIRGKCVPLDEVRRIADWAHERGIKVHMDGARLWNACYGPGARRSSSPAEAARTATDTLRQYCAAVDTVSMCFSKSLGAPCGSIVVARQADTLAKAVHFRKALGGGLRQVGVLSAPARTAVEEVFLSGRHLLKANAMAMRVQETWRQFGGEVQPGLEQETNMVWLDLKKARVTDEEFVRITGEEGIKCFGGRVVTHHQISEDALDRLERAFNRIIEVGLKRKRDPAPERQVGANQAVAPEAAE